MSFQKFVSSVYSQVMIGEPIFVNSGKFWTLTVYSKVFFHQSSFEFSQSTTLKGLEWLNKIRTSCLKCKSLKPALVSSLNSPPSDVDWRSVKSGLSFDTEGKLSLYYSLFAVGLCSKFLQYLNPCHASPLADSSECMVLRKQAQNFKNILNHFHL